MFGEYTPLMKTGILKRRLANGKSRIDTLLGLEKYCPNCHEYWPQDTLFWSLCSSNQTDGLQAWCKACQSESKTKSRASHA